MISWSHLDLLIKGTAVFVGLFMPYIIGSNHYHLAMDRPYPLFSALVFAVIGSFFSLGLLLSVTKFGQRFKYITLLLLLISYPVHFVYFMTSYTAQFILLMIYFAIGIALFKRGSK